MSESESEYKIINGHNILIICFGGMALQFGGILPFEFLTYLSSIYLDKCDLYFFIDKHQCCYHKGIKDITNNIDETVTYINNIITNGAYEKVICMGVSAGGYGAILFGSLCNNVTNVISFIPPTIINNPINAKYSNLKYIINSKTNYVLYGDKSVTNNNDAHHISQCENIEHFINVKIIKGDDCIMRKLKTNGTIKRLIDNAINYI